MNDYDQLMTKMTGTLYVITWMITTT